MAENTTFYIGTARDRRMIGDSAAISRPQLACSGREKPSMRAYLITTGTVFALIFTAHLLRVIAEGAHVGADPVFILLTLAAAALSCWAWCLLRGSTGR